MEMFGAVFRNSKEEIKELFKKGVEVDAKDEKQRTPLFYTVVDDQPELFDLLVENGADTKVKDGDERSLLHMAAIHQRLWAVKKLIAAALDVEDKDKFGNTALSEAVFNSKGEGEIIKLLLEAGADPDNKNSYGVSPRELADTISNYDVKQFFE